MLLVAREEWCPGAPHLPNLAPKGEGGGQTKEHEEGLAPAGTRGLRLPERSEMLGWGDAQGSSDEDPFFGCEIRSPHEIFWACEGGP